VGIGWNETGSSFCAGMAGRVARARMFRVEVDGPASDLTWGAIRGVVDLMDGAAGVAFDFMFRPCGCAGSGAGLAMAFGGGGGVAGLTVGVGATARGAIGACGTVGAWRDCCGGATDRAGA
jgi:hypothetical protein